MSTGVRYTHTNLIANDWRRLVDFYCRAFGCEMVGAERDLHGGDIDRLTGVSEATIRGRHVRLPGYGDGGPTLEIFQYGENDAARPPSINRPGLAHLAFEVPDIAATRAEVHRMGGWDYGDFVTLDVPGAGVLSVQYVCDPEGNIIELQSWSR